MDNISILVMAMKVLEDLKGRTLDVVTIKKPVDLQSAIGLSKIISKLSPLVGNTIESIVAQDLNSQSSLWPAGCKWVRQDPDFPDVVLTGVAEPRPGLEVKAWMPLATEITGRFRDSQSTLKYHSAKVVVVCWLPEYVIAGSPKVIDIFVCDAMDFAIARDKHYHNPPWYVLREPEDTATRTKNLQQKNTNAFVFQHPRDSDEFREAEALVASWGTDAKIYRSDPEYQALLADLMGRFQYRGETNFAKIDRINLASLEEFKTRMYRTKFIDRPIQSWRAALRRKDIHPFLQFIEGDISSTLLSRSLWDEIEED